MTFSIRLAGVEGGRAAISVGMPRRQAGRRTLMLRAVGESTPFVSAFQRLRDEHLTQIDLGGLLPVKWTSQRSRGEEQRVLLTTFGTPIQQRLEQRGTTQVRRRQIAPPVLEGLSALYLLRSAPLAPGDRLLLRVLSGLNLYRVQIRVGGPERVVVRERPHQALRLDGVARRIGDRGRPLRSHPPRKFTLWLGHDGRRLPYRIQGDTTVGPAEAVLTSHHPARIPLRVRACRIAPPPTP